MKKALLGSELIKKLWRYSKILGRRHLLVQNTAKDFGLSPKPRGFKFV
jgi:hypothetical protein